MGLQHNKLKRAAGDLYRNEDLTTIFLPLEDPATVGDTFPMHRESGHSIRDVDSLEVSHIPVRIDF